MTKCLYFQTTRDLHSAKISACILYLKAHPVKKTYQSVCQSSTYVSTTLVCRPGLPAGPPSRAPAVLPSTLLLPLLPCGLRSSPKLMSMTTLSPHDWPTRCKDLHTRCWTIQILHLHTAYSTHCIHILHAHTAYSKRPQISNPRACTQCTIHVLQWYSRHCA